MLARLPVFAGDDHPQPRGVEARQPDKERPELRAILVLHEHGFVIAGRWRVEREIELLINEA